MTSDPADGLPGPAVRLITVSAAYGAGGSVVMQRDRGLAEGFAVGLDHGLAELLELAGHHLFGCRNRVGRLCRRLLQRVGKDLLLVGCELLRVSH